MDVDPRYGATKNPVALQHLKRKILINKNKNPYPHTMIKNRFKRTFQSEDIENPEMIKMAEYIFNHPNNTKAEEFTQPNDAMNYEVDPDVSGSTYRNFNYKHWYAHKLKNINPGNVDKFIKNKMKLVIEPQHVGNLYKHAQAENVYELEYSRQHNFNVRSYSVINKPENTFTKKSTNNFRLTKPLTKVTKKISSFLSSAAKNSESKIDNGLGADEFAANMVKFRNEFLADPNNILRENLNVAKYKHRIQNVTKPPTLYGILPRYDHNLRRLKPYECVFNPESTAYKFVSNYGHLQVERITSKGM